MPGVGFRTALKLLTIVGHGTAFPTPDHRRQSQTLVLTHR
jgi:hypothetical protein